jgi:hypothetical protein
VKYCGLEIDGEINECKIWFGSLLENGYMEERERDGVQYSYGF